MVDSINLAVKYARDANHRRLSHISSAKEYAEHPVFVQHFNNMADREFNHQKHMMRSARESKKFYKKYMIFCKIVYPTMFLATVAFIFFH